MQNYPSPSLEKAIFAIRNLLSDPEVKRLPSVRTLAQNINVSVITITRAVAILKQEGAIVSVWGRGNFKNSNSTQTAPVPLLNYKTQRTPKYQKEVAKFKKDLLNGKFPLNHPLPAIKQLEYIYSVSYPTICKMLSLLVTERILKREGSKYYLYTNRTISRQRIAVIAFGLESNTIKVGTERERNFYQLLSVAASQQAVDLDIISYNDYLDTPQYFIPDGDTLQNYFKKNDICGVILSSYHMNNSAECLHHLVSMDKPVSIWIEDNKVLQSVERYHKGYSGVAFFDTSYSKLPGIDVGQYLLNKGHHAIAYISPFHGSLWSHNRLDGLRQVFSGEKKSCNVFEYVLTEFSSDYDFMRIILEKSSFNEDVQVKNLTDKLTAFMKKRLSIVKFEYDQLLRDNLIFSYCKPLIKQASSRPEITAWVCANDLVACMVMDYWNYSKTHHCKRPALIGFDNTFKSHEKGISSYEFNTIGEVNNMISHLLYPNSSLFSGKKRIIRLNGSVIERTSTKIPSKSVR